MSEHPVKHGQICTNGLGCVTGGDRSLGDFLQVATDNRGIVEAFGPAGKFLHSALAALSVEDTVAFFEGEGVPTKVEETGKVFPVSNKATDVLEAFLRRLRRAQGRCGRSKRKF